MERVTHQKNSVNCIMIWLFFITQGKFLLRDTLKNLWNHRLSQSIILQGTRKLFNIFVFLQAKRCMLNIWSWCHDNILPISHDHFWNFMSATTLLRVWYNYYSIRIYTLRKVRTVICATLILLQRNIGNKWRYIISLISL